jgi:pimeloyl-ACP methyl ester carboxylesterase
MEKDSKLEGIANVNGVDIAYQLHGNSLHPTLLLIQGLSTPLTGWPGVMIERFVAANFQVLLLDNRDVGCSEQLDHLSIPNMAWVITKYKLGLSIKTPYKLEDMMQDVIALMDILNLPKVHVVGASMGGMIAQLMAIHHPIRVNTLTSIMSTTGYKTLPSVRADVSEILIKTPTSKSYEDQMYYHIKKWKAIGSPDYPPSDAYLNEYVDSLLKRGITEKGTMRHVLALLATDNREQALSKLDIPSLVIHGDGDRLINVAGGQATANAIPNAKLKIYPGMGHDFPVELIPNITDDIVTHINSTLL